MMRIFQFALIMMIVFFVIGCSDEGNEQVETLNENEKNSTTVENETEEPQFENEEKTSQEASDDEQEQQNEREVWMSGEVLVEEDKITVQGESNIEPGLQISSFGQSVLAIANFNDSAEVQQDGSFYFEFPGYDGNATLTFKLTSSFGDAEEYYGKGFQHATGAQVYRTSSANRYEPKFTVYLDESKEKPYTIPVEIPEWKEQPEDYGDLEIWIDNIEITSDHNYLYIYGESNLLEGTVVNQLRKNKNDRIIPFTGDSTHVNPDGTFRLSEHYTSLAEGMYFQIRVDPKNNYWEHVEESYGENFEHIDGELVKVDEDGLPYIEVIVPIEVPELSVPEEVDLTMEEEEVKLQIKDKVLFNFDQSELKTDAANTLYVIIQDLETLPDDTVVHINGHTDNQGNADYNQRLSEERAQSVFHYLSENGNLEHLEIIKQGFGETQPRASNEDANGQSQNRRVEIVINPDGE